jgi:hypothetical protein
MSLSLADIDPDILSKYPSVPQDQMLASLEIATIRACRQIYGRPATAIVDDSGLHASIYDRQGREKQIDVRKLKRWNKRLLLDQIEIALTSEQAVQDARVYRTLGGTVVAGCIEHIRKDGSLIVAIEINDVLAPITITALCPVRQQPPHQLFEYQRGEVRQFFVTSCLPVTNGRHSTVRTIVSRVDRQLPAHLLSILTKLPGIRCTERRAGIYSQITTKYMLPKEAIIQVNKELRERLYVTCTAARQN